MKKLIYTLSLIFVSSSLIAGDGIGNYYINQDYLERKFDYAKREHAEKTGKLIDFYIDLQLGMGITNANISSQPSVGNYDTDSKAGFNAGAIFFINLFDAIQFSSGLDFVGKNFKVNPPTLSGIIGPGIDTTQNEVSNQYLNIPLNFNFGGMVSEKIGLTFNGGPYLGLLLSTDDKLGLGYKNFDLGLNGTLTVNYLVAPFTSVLLGTKLQYGGLNNLGKTETVESISTLNYGFFTGVRFGL